MEGHETAEAHTEHDERKAGSDLEWDDLSDISDNMDCFLPHVDEDKDFVTNEDKELARIDTLRDMLRCHPLMPADPADTSQPYVKADSGVRLPMLHCAFKNCIWCEDHVQDTGHWGLEWRLFNHLMMDHRDAFAHELRSCGVELAALATDVSDGRLPSKFPRCAKKHYIFPQNTGMIICS